MTLDDLLIDAGKDRGSDTDETSDDKRDHVVRMVLFDLNTPLRRRFSGRFGDAQREDTVFKSGL